MNDQLPIHEERRRVLKSPCAGTVVRHTAGENAECERFAHVGIGNRPTEQVREFTSHPFEPLGLR
jgi:hypothetical protein